MPVSQRKLLGAWYTPPELVDAVVGEVRRGFTPRTVLGPGVWRRPLPRTVRRHCRRHRRRHRSERRRGHTATRCRPTGATSSSTPSSATHRSSTSCRQPTSRRRPIAVRRRPVRRQRRRVPDAGGPADTTRWPSRARAAAFDVVDTRRRSHSGRRVTARRVALDVVVADLDVRRERARLGRSVGSGRVAGRGATVVRAPVRTQTIDRDAATSGAA